MMAMMSPVRVFPADRDSLFQDIESPHSLFQDIESPHSLFQDIESPHWSFEENQEDEGEVLQASHLS